MAALTGQDYKAQRHSTRDARRLRDFGYGTACGALLTGIAAAWLGTRLHGAGVPPPALAQQAPHLASAPASGAGCAEPLTFAKRLSGHDLDVPLPPKSPGAQGITGKSGQGH